MASCPLQLRHNERHCVSNHQYLDCLLNRLFRGTSKRTSKPRVTGFVREIHWWPMDSPHKGLVTRMMFPFDNVGKSAQSICIKHTYTQSTSKMKWNNITNKNIKPEVILILMPGYMLLRYCGISLYLDLVPITQSVFEHIIKILRNSLCYKFASHNPIR